MSSRAVASSFYPSRCIKGQHVSSDLDRSRPFFLFVVSALLTLTILGAIFYIGLRVKVVNLGYRINQEIQSKERMIEENKRLNLEIARLKSPTRLEFEAKQRLGLQAPAPHQIIYLGESASALDAALAKIKPLPAPQIAASVAASPRVKPPAAEVQKTPAPKPREKTQPNPILAKAAKDPAVHSLAVEKPAPLPAAKLPRPKEGKAMAMKKSPELKRRPAGGEAIPAAMLDTMP